MDLNAWDEAVQQRRVQFERVLNLSALQRKDPQLATAFKIDESIGLQTFQAFEASLQGLCTQYASKKAPQIVEEKLQPHIDRTRSFAAAIAASTQSDASAKFCLSSLFITIQCIWAFAESPKHILKQLRELHLLMPDSFTKYNELCSSNQTLQTSLLGIFKGYLDYCIVIIRFLRRQRFINILRQLVFLSLKRDLGRIRSRIIEQVKWFKEETNRAHYQRPKFVDERSSTRPQEDLHHRASKSAPSIHTVTLQRNPDFYGREIQLGEIYDHLIKSGKPAQPTSCAIQGIGGVGKTQTALEFTFRNWDHYQAIFWITAENEFDLRSTYGAVGRKFKLFDTEDIQQPKVEMIQEKLQTTELRWLLVFDDVCDFSSIWNYVPTSSRAASSMIITSQRPGEWCNHKVKIEPLDEKIGSELLLSQLKGEAVTNIDANRELAREISSSVGGLPLWVNQARRFIRDSRCSLEDFLTSLRADITLLEESNMGADVSWYERAFSTAFDRTLDRLSKDSVDLLFMLAFFNPTNVREDLLLGDHREKCLDFLHTKNRHRYLHMLKEISAAEFVQREKGETCYYLTTHRSLQVGLLLKLNKDTGRRQEAFERALSLLREVVPPPSHVLQADAETWPSTLKVLPHLLSLVEAFDQAQPRIEIPLLFPELLTDVGGMNMYDRGFTAKAQVLLKKAEETLDVLKSPLNTTLRGNVLTLLGLCTDTLGISERANGLKVRQRGLEVRKKYFATVDRKDREREDEILLFNAETDLACSLQQLNSLEEVGKICKRCLKEYRSWGNEEQYPYEYAKYHNHMAYVFLFDGNTQKATESAKKGFELMARGSPGAQIAVTFRFDWATIRFQNGETASAISEHKIILESRVQECGDYNILTLQSRLIIGIMFFWDENYVEAERWIRQTLKLNKKVHWPSENVARAKYYLARALTKSNNSLDEACNLDREAKASLEKLLLRWGSDTVKEYLEPKNYPILFDYLVPWECRLVTPRSPSCLKEIANVNENAPH